MVDWKNKNLARPRKKRRENGIITNPDRPEYLQNSHNDLRENSKKAKMTRVLKGRKERGKQEGEKKRKREGLCKGSRPSTTRKGVPTKKRNLHR